MSFVLKMINDYRDMYIRWENHPKYNENEIIEDDYINMMVQKLEMLLFTNKGECFGDPGMGCNLEYYLWQTNIPGNMIQNNIESQISAYIPELNVVGYDLSIDLYQGVEKDKMFLNFVIKGYNINFALI